MTPQEAGTALQTLLDNVVKKDKLLFSAVLGVAHGDSGFTWSGAAGYADQARRTPMNPPFFVASVTKLYTAAAILLLQEQGSLDLSDKLSKHLPDALIEWIHRFKGTDCSRSLTIRHLISMTSGIADYSLDNKFAPGTKAYYSDTNYYLLGAIIEAVTGQPLHMVFEEFFFRPLSMTQTCLYGYPRTNPPGEHASSSHFSTATASCASSCPGSCRPSPHPPSWSGIPAQAVRSYTTPRSATSISPARSTSISGSVPRSRSC